MTNRARSSSPRSVARTHRDVASSKRASATRVWNRARRYRSKVRPKAWQWREDLRLEHVLHGGDGADLFEERQVDVGLHVARRARVAVPVPGAPEVTAALEDEEVVDALLRQARRGEHPREPATDDHDIGLDLLRVPLLDRRVRIFGVVLQRTRHRAELRQAFGPQGPPLVALFVVLLLERDWVEVESVGVRHRKVTVHCHASLRLAAGSGSRRRWTYTDEHAEAARRRANDHGSSLRASPAVLGGYSRQAMTFPSRNRVTPAR